MHASEIVARQERRMLRSIQTVELVGTDPFRLRITFDQSFEIDHRLLHQADILYWGVWKITGMRDDKDNRCVFVATLGASDKDIRNIGEGKFPDSGNIVVVCLKEWQTFPVLSLPS